MPKPEQADELEALQRILHALSPLAPDAQRRILQSATVFLAIESDQPSPTPAPTAAAPSQLGDRFEFTGRSDLSPKQFLAEKQPETDIERVACLAYYLTHYREQPHFKTIDISKLNTEAAQLKFSNAANAVSNATQRGFLAQAGKGSKQLTMVGEHFVSALPDHNAAKAAADSAMPKRRRNKRGSKVTKPKS